MFFASTLKSKISILFSKNIFLLLDMTEKYNGLS